MLQQSAAASILNLGFNWQDNPIYQTMPAPYLWYEPSLPQYWKMATDQDGSLYSLGTLQPATFGTNPFYPVRRTAWTPPGGGTAQYMTDDSTIVDSNDDSLEVTAASDYSSTGVSIVAMIKSEGDPTTGNVYVNVGLGGVGFGFAGTGGGNDFITAGIYPSGNGLVYTTQIVGGQPESTNFRCYIATFQSVNVLGTLFTRIELYRNGTLLSTTDLGYSMESYAASKDILMIGLNRFYFGSMMRFNYLLSQTQVNTITNYMTSIWGTLA